MTACALKTEKRNNVNNKLSYALCRPYHRNCACIHTYYSNLSSTHGN